MKAEPSRRQEGIEVKWQNVGELPCPIARTLSVIGDRWSMLIVRNAFMRMRRFDEFQSSLGVPKHILSMRLKKLVESEVLRREPYQQTPLRYEYRLTERGRELYPLVLAMAGWGNKWMDGGRGPLLTYTHTECGQAFQPAIACSECGEPVQPHQVMLSPGPGLFVDAGQENVG